MSFLCRLGTFRLEKFDGGESKVVVEAPERNSVRGLLSGVDGEGDIAEGSSRGLAGATVEYRWEGAIPLVNVTRQERLVKTVRCSMSSLAMNKRLPALSETLL